MADLGSKKKIVYLFGAGATHAELDNIDTAQVEKGRGLLISDVSRRVIAKARLNSRYLEGIEMVSAPKGAPNIELLISLIESSKIDDWEFRTQYLKKLVRHDIERILTKSRIRDFHLHKALLQLHQLKVVKRHEELLALVSLNYDDVLDHAYKSVFRKDPDYCFTLEAPPSRLQNLPLLKLHGSFNWSAQTIHGRKRAVEIIPFGANKNYLHVPYVFIWNRALEVLIECDKLRVIGCSLSQNDGHLVDLLFKAHLERGRPFDVEVIDMQRTGEQIRGHYGFFPNIKALTEIEGDLIPNPDPDNPFKEWLKYKTIKMLGGSTNPTGYLKRVTA
jgi:hypothetical protein